MKFLVVKGCNKIRGSNGLEYSIFDVITFDPFSDLEEQQRKYVWRKLYEVDKKNPKKFEEDVWSRKRHLNDANGKLIAAATIFDSLSGIFYGFIPMDELNTFRG